MRYVEVKLPNGELVVGEVIVDDDGIMICSEMKTGQKFEVTIWEED